MPKYKLARKPKFDRTGRRGEQFRASGTTSPRVSFFRVFFFGLKFTFSYAPKFMILFCIVGILNGAILGFGILTNQLLFDSVENAVTGAGMLRTAYMMLILFGVVAVLRRVIVRLFNFLFAQITTKFEGGLNQIQNRKTSRIDPIAFEKVSFHEIIEKADRGIWSVIGLTTTLLHIFIFYIPFFTFMAFYLHHVSPHFIFAIVLVFLPTMFGQIIRTKITSKFVDETAPIRREHDFYYNAISNKFYYKETRILGAYGFFFARFRGMMKQLSKAELRANRKTNLLNLGLSLLSTAGYAGILYMLVTALLAGEISVGAFAAVYGSIDMMFGWMENLMQNQIGRVAADMGFAHNFMRFLDLPERHGSDKITPDASKGIIAENVTFTYPLADKKSIENVSIAIAPNETVAIIGENGAGKSTLVRLLIGLYTPDEGRVLFGGLDTKETKMTALFNGLTGVFQRFMTYQMTLKENVQIVAVY